MPVFPFAKSISEVGSDSKDALEVALSDSIDRLKDENITLKERLKLLTTINDDLVLKMDKMKLCLTFIVRSDNETTKN